MPHGFVRNMIEVNSGWQELLGVINDHEQALRNNDQQAEGAAFKAAEKIFPAGNASGQIKQSIDEARSEKTASVQRACASASRFSEMLPSFKENPTIVENQLLQETIRKIWSNGSTDTFYIPKKQTLYLNIESLTGKSDDEIV